MSDIRLTFGAFEGDLVIGDNDLDVDDGLQTAVIVSLFTDRRAADGDTLPDGHTDRRGWWGDGVPVVPSDQIGSRLWLLCREKQQPSVIVRAREYALEALQWLIDDRIAERVDVVAEFTQPGMLGLQVVITRPQTDAVNFRFDYTWAAQAARAA